MKTIKEAITSIYNMTQEEYDTLLKGIIAYELELSVNETLVNEIYDKFRKDNTNASFLSERFIDYYNEVQKDITIKELGLKPVEFNIS